jgi:hypothetical protein
MSDNSFWGNFNAMQQDTAERAKRLEKFFNRDTSFDDKAYFKTANPFAIGSASSASQAPVKPAQVDLIAQEQADKKKYLQEAIKLELSGDALKQYIQAKMQPVVVPPPPPKADKIAFKDLSKEERDVYLKAMSGAADAGLDDPEAFAREQIIELRKASVDKTGGKKRSHSPTGDDQAAREQAKAARRLRREFKRLAVMLDGDSFKKDDDWKHGCRQILPASVTANFTTISAQFARDIKAAHGKKWGYPAFALMTNGRDEMTPWKLPDKQAKNAYKTFLTELGLPDDYSGEDA